MTTRATSTTVKRDEGLPRATFVAASVLEDGGWEVQRPKRGDGFKLVVRGRGIAYTAHVKSATEGRSDRLVPLFAQAVLQAAHAAVKATKPLAIEQVIRFAQEYAPHTAAGVVDFEGLALFHGPELERLNAYPRRVPVTARPATRPGHLFSDLNQWMLKVLLAPELPEELLAAPRGRYRNATELARAAEVSVMSAFRFVRQLEREGYLHESAAHLTLVRREDLFRRWQGLATKTVAETPMRFLLPGDANVLLRKVLERGRACAALFAAADALRLGHVVGVPPHVYLERVDAATLATWNELRLCGPGEPPEVIVREAPARQSVFRGRVMPGGMPAADVLQVWTDVAAHPSRGREQADLIYRKVLQSVIKARL
jgi:hypothetical protein